MEKETSSLNFAWQKQTPYTKLLHSNRALDSTKACQDKVVTNKKNGYKNINTQNLLSREKILAANPSKIQ